MWSLRARQCPSSHRCKTCRSTWPCKTLYVSHSESPCASSDLCTSWWLEIQACESLSVARVRLSSGGPSNQRRPLTHFAWGWCSSAWDFHLRCLLLVCCLQPTVSFQTCRVPLGIHCWNSDSHHQTSTFWRLPTPSSKQHTYCKTSLYCQMCGQCHWIFPFLLGHYKL